MSAPPPDQVRVTMPSQSSPPYSSPPYSSPPYGSTEVAGPPPHYGDVPPTYEDSTDPNGIFLFQFLLFHIIIYLLPAAPPSYDSLYGEFRQVNNPTGLFHFFIKAIGVVIGTGR